MLSTSRPKWGVRILGLAKGAFGTFKTLGGVTTLAVRNPTGVRVPFAADNRFLSKQQWPKLCLGFLTYTNFVLVKIQRTMSMFTPFDPMGTYQFSS
jgi:hypothetical protein